jgi:hypothetical protein
LIEREVTRMKKMALSTVLILVSCGEVADENYALHLAVTSVEPMHAPSTGGTRVTIRGRRLCPELQVSFGETPAASIEVISSDAAIAVTPPHLAGKVDVRVACGGEAFVHAQRFVFTSADIRLQTALRWPVGVDGPVEFADVDGDGLDDLLAYQGAPFDINTVSGMNIHLNDRKNGFESTVFKSIVLDGEYTILRDGVHVEDYDGDGLNDILILAYPSSLSRTHLTARLRTAKDAFEETASARIDSTRGEISALVAKDLTGDGRVDLLVAQGSSLVFVPGEDGFSFGAQRVLFESSGRLGSMLSPKSRDFDADGLNDAILRVLPFTANAGSSTLFVHGNASGMLAVQSLEVTIDQELIFFDEDTLPDVFSTLEDGTGLRVMIARAIDFGTFGAPVEVAYCRECDLYSLRYLSDSPVRYDGDRDGNGEYVFDALQEIKYVEFQDGFLNISPIGPGSVLGYARMTRSGLPALVYSDLTVFSPKIAHYRGRSPGGEHVFSELALVGQATTLACPGDFDGDGVEDVISGMPTQYLSTPLVLHAGNGDGTFAPPVVLDSDLGLVDRGFAATPCRTGDLNGDGRLDFVVSAYQNAPDEYGPEAAFVSTAQGGFHVEIFSADLAAEDPHAMVADVDGDGTAEVVLRRSCDEHRSAGVCGFVVLRLGADGHFTRAETLELDGFAGPDPAFADVNGDGAIDVAIALPTQIEIRLGAHDGSRVTLAASPAQSLTIGEAGGEHKGYADLRWLDLDGDGDLDLLAANPNTATFVFANDGTGNVAETQQVRDANVMQFRGACDLDGDGRRDLLFDTEDGLLGWARQDSSAIVFGDVQWVDGSALQLFKPGRDPWARFDFHCADVDADGLEDPMFIEPYLGSYHVLHNRSH